MVQVLLEPSSPAFKMDSQPQHRTYLHVNDANDSATFKQHGSQADSAAVYI